MLCHLLRNGPVPWLQDLHPIPPVHPAWRNVNSVFGRFARFGGRCRLRLLNNDDLSALIVESIPTKKSKAVPVHSRSPDAARPAERLTCTKSKVRLGQGNADSENKTEDHTPSTIRQFHTIFFPLLW